MPVLTDNLVSIIMPAYNAAQHLGEAIESVRAQTYPHWELLIVDDKSTDDTLSLASSLSQRDPRIRVIGNTSNRGVAQTRNLGIQAAQGQYLAFLDSDDLWLAHKLEVQVDFMKRKDIGFSFTSYRRFSEAGLGSPVRVPAKVGYRSLLKRNVIGCLTVLIDRHRIPEVSMPAVGHEDFAAWLKILREGHQAWGIAEDLARYRLSSDSVSSKKTRSASWTWHIYRREEKLTFSGSLWNFSHYAGKAVQQRLAEQRRNKVSPFRLARTVIGRVKGLS